MAIPGTNRISQEILIGRSRCTAIYIAPSVVPVYGHDVFHCGLCLVQTVQTSGIGAERCGQSGIYFTIERDF
jgi:hypothetical protein